MVKYAPWERYIAGVDKTVLSQGGFGGLMGFPKRPALLIIDVSLGFCGDRPEPIEFGSKRFPLSCGLAAWDALLKIETLIAAARSNDVPVIYTTGEFRADGWDYGAWRWKQTKADGDEPAGADLDMNAIMPQIAPRKEDLVLRKQKPSAFFGTNLIGYLNLLECDGVVLTGCTTSGCVRATAVDAGSHNYRVTVAGDACFDRLDISHAVSLLDLHIKYADVLSSSDAAMLFNTLPPGLFPNRPRS